MEISGCDCKIKWGSDVCLYGVRGVTHAQVKDYEEQRRQQPDIDKAILELLRGRPF